MRSFYLFLLKCFIFYTSFVSVITFANFLVPPSCLEKTKNITLKGCTLIEPPYVEEDHFNKNPRFGFTGIAIDYLKELTDRLNFQVTLTKWNGTFSAFLDHIATCDVSNCTCEIGVGSFTVTSERVSRVDFIWPFSNENHRMVTRTSSLEKDGSRSKFFLLQTFDGKSWIIIFCAVVVHACFTALCYGDDGMKWIKSNERFHSKFLECIPYKKLRQKIPKKHNPSICHQFAIHYLRSFSHFLGQPIDTERRFRTTANTDNNTNMHPCFGGANGQRQSHMREATASMKKLDHSIPSKRSTASETDTQISGQFSEFTENQDFSVITQQSNENRGAADEENKRHHHHHHPHPHHAGVEGVDCEQRFIGMSLNRFIWWLLPLTAGIFLLEVYSASVTVLLFESRQVSKFRTIDDVKSCLIHPSRVSFISGGASQALWEKTMKSINCADNQRRPAENNEKNVKAKNIHHGYSLLLEDQPKIDYFFSLEGSILLTTRRRCDELAVVGEPFFSTSVGFVIPRNLPKTQKLKKCMSQLTHELREEDLITSARTQALKDSCGDVPPPTVTLDKLVLFFALYFGILVFTLLYRFLAKCCSV